jgi:hypothetical protein
MATVTLQSVLDGAKVGWDSTVMTGTAVRTSDWIDLGDKVADLGVMFQWTNGTAVAGAFTAQQSNDASAVASLSISSPSVSSNNGPAYLAVASKARYVRFIYTNTSGTGTLGDLQVQGKRA